MNHFDLILLSTLFSLDDVETLAKTVPAVAKFGTRAGTFTSDGKYLLCFTSWLAPTDGLSYIVVYYDFMITVQQEMG